VPGAVRRQLLAGVTLDDGPAAADAFRVVSTVGGRALVEVVLHEGRKHIVRRLLAEVGHPVARLVRTAVGPVKLGALKPGHTRRLTKPEVAALFAAVGEGRVSQASDHPAGTRSRPRQVPGRSRN
jgi:23S rRNA pseudouridine2605 synthase